MGLFSIFDAKSKGVKGAKYEFVSNSKDKMGLLHGNKLIIPLVYDNIRWTKYYFFQLCIRSHKKDKYGLADLNGNILLEVKFDIIEFVNSTRVKVYIDGKCYVTDLIIPSN